MALIQLFTKSQQVNLLNYNNYLDGTHLIQTINYSF